MRFSSLKHLNIFILLHNLHIDSTQAKHLNVANSFNNKPLLSNSDNNLNNFYFILHIMFRNKLFEFSKCKISLSKQK